MTPPIDIRSDHLRIVQDVLRQHLPDGVKVWVFGSRASWTTKDSSDLDLALEGETCVPRRSLAMLEAAFEESDLPFAVDIVDLSRIGKRFRQIVTKQRVPLSRTGSGSISRRRTRRDNWRETHWGDVVTLEYGRALRGYESSRGTFRVFGTNGPIGWHDEALCEHASVIVGRKGAYRGIHYSADPFFVIDTAFYLKPKSEMDVRWAYYVLLTQDINGMDSGSAIPSTSREEFYSVPVSVPPLSEQRAIAHILGTLDDKIELNRRMNETLEAMARALFKSWFVDFDPVRAKMEGRDPALPKHIADLFPDLFVDSELGEIPEGWEVSTIGQEVDVVGGSTPSTKDPSFWNGAINWATPKDLSSLASPVLVETSRRISEKGLGKISSGLLPRGTVLLSSRAPIGYLAIADVPIAINQGFIAMKCRKRLSAAYVWLWTAANIDSILENANGSTFQEISKTNFRPLPAIVPHQSIREIHDQCIRSLYNRIVKNERGSRTLAALRDALLPKLITGELRLKNAGVFFAGAS